MHVPGKDSLGPLRKGLEVNQLAGYVSQLFLIAFQCVQCVIELASQFANFQCGQMLLKGSRVCCLMAAQGLLDLTSFAACLADTLFQRLQLATDTHVFIGKTQRRLQCFFVASLALRQGFPAGQLTELAFQCVQVSSVGQHQRW